LKKDLLHVRYDPGKATPEQLVQTVGKQGFQAKIVSGPEPAGRR
jgi:hypothetical protein